MFTLVKSGIFIQKDNVDFENILKLDGWVKLKKKKIPSIYAILKY